MEQKPFEGWVRVLCGGTLAFAAYAAYASRMAETPPLAWEAVASLAFFGTAAAGFAIWPERLAYGYRGGAGVPRWSRPPSVTRVDDDAPGLPAEGFADYRPSLRHLRSAFLSVVGYGLIAMRLSKAADQVLVWGVLIGAVAILYLATRHAPAD